MMGSDQYVLMGELPTQACRMGIIVLKSAPMDIKDFLAVLAITGLLVKKPYFIPYVCYQLVINSGIWPLLNSSMSLINHVIYLLKEKVKTSESFG
jgi:hypothetical protein